MLITTKEIPITTFENYKRLFTYGCSMTGHRWPTWADILGQEIPSYKNYGVEGAGNQLISTHFLESNISENFNNKDVIIIMFSHYMREDRYIEKLGWNVRGNLFSAKHCKWFKMFRKNRDWYNESHARYRDLIYMYCVKEILVNKSCLSYFGTMNDEYNHTNNLTTPITNLTQHILPFLGYSMREAGCCGQWPRYSHISEEYHPSPAQHFTYLKKVFPNVIWKETTINFVNFWEQFIHTHSYETIISKWNKFKNDNSTKYPIS